MNSSLSDQISAPRASRTAAFVLNVETAPINLQALGPSISLLALNFDHRDHLHLISEFLALNAPKEKDSLFERITVTSELDDWRIVVTHILQTEDKVLGILSCEHKNVGPELNPVVALTFIQPRDWTNSERRSVIETLRHVLSDMASRQGWGQIELNGNPGSELLKELGLPKIIENGIEVTKFI
jgi:hypothetical protein